MCAGILANKLGLTWRTKEGTHKANYFGSITQVPYYYYTHTRPHPPLPFERPVLSSFI
jgi:hypothetical protein